MSRVIIANDSDRNPTVPAGTYGADGTVKLMKVEVKELTRGTGETVTFLSFTALIPSENGTVFARNSPFAARIDSGSGSRVKQWLLQLGYPVPEDQDFEVDDAALNEKLAGIPVVVEVNYREYTRNDGTAAVNNDITNISVLP